MARFFWPGLLSIIGIAGPSFLALVYLFETVIAFYIILIDVLALAYVCLTVLLFTFARRLFVEPTRRKLWGVLVVIFYGLGFYTVVILLNFASNDTSYPLVHSLDLACVVLYILGPVGGIWGVLSRASPAQS